MEQTPRPKDGMMHAVSAANVPRRSLRGTKWPTWTFLLKDADGKVLWYHDKKDAPAVVPENVVKNQGLYYVEVNEWQTDASIYHQRELSHRIITTFVF